MRVVWLVAIVLVGAAAAAASAAQPSWSLTGAWRGSAGNTMQLEQHGTGIAWVATAADGTSWVHDFTGSISGDTITGRFQDRPGHALHNSGSISAHVLNACTFVITRVAFDGGSTSSGGERFTRTPCTSAAAKPVPISTVSNGCGGAGWRLFVKAQNFLGNTSTYWNSDDLYNPAAKPYTVDFRDACNLHDAGYAGAVVKDVLRGGIKDFSHWSRKQVDEKFLADMRLLCHRHIPASAAVALRNCLATGGNVSIGAKSRYNFVRCWGNRFFDADPARPGTQSAGPRRNDKLPITSPYCRFAG
ncbi:MAG TPA: phospholipase A2 [Gaiellaceae bacterium]|nr:phospholipase A2 [Gaiellaceae bacterium]